MAVKEKINLEEVDTKSLKGRIRLIRGYKNQKEFASFLGIDRSSLVRYESGDARPTTDFYIAIASKTKFNLHWLITGIGLPGEDSKYFTPVLEWNKYFGNENDLNEKEVSYTAKKVIAESKIVKVFGKVAAGTPIQMWNNEEYTISVSHPILNKNHKQFYGFVVTGDSMFPRYRDGDVVIAAEFDVNSVKPKNRDIVVTIFDSDPESSSANIKLLNWANEDKTQFILKSINPYHVDTVHHLKNVKRMFKVYLSLSEVNYK